MILTISEITDRVYALLDENRELLEERVEYADPGTQLGPLIKALLPEAARKTLLEVPLSQIGECAVMDPLGVKTEDVQTLNATDDRARAGALTGGNLSGGNSGNLGTPGIVGSEDIPAVKWLGGNRGYLSLPDNFLRLVWFRMSDWEEGVSVAMEYNSDTMALRKRLRNGTTCDSRTPSDYHYRRPAVAIRTRGRKKELLIFGISEEANLMELDYVALPTIEKETINIPAGAVHDVCCRLADMVKAIIGPRNWA